MSLMDPTCFILACSPPKAPLKAFLISPCCVTTQTNPKSNHKQSPLTTTTSHSSTQLTSPNNPKSRSASTQTPKTSSPLSSPPARHPAALLPTFTRTSPPSACLPPTPSSYTPSSTSRGDSPPSSTTTAPRPPRQPSPSSASSVSSCSGYCVCQLQMRSRKAAVLRRPFNSLARFGVFGNGPAFNNTHNSCEVVKVMLGKVCFPQLEWQCLEPAGSGSSAYGIAAMIIY
jgi:hypothetical protein